VWHITPTDNVYSYFMFVTPTELAKEGAELTWDTMMAWILVFMGVFMQSILLGTVYNEVVDANISWQASIVKVGGGGFMAEAPPKCNPGGSMCSFDSTGNYTCAPPSVQLTGRWEELDTDGDGIWTREEVEANQEALQCKYIVNPVEVFDVFINLLKEREKILWLHPDIKAGKAIHKAYFNFAAGDVIMCGYRSHDMCPNLLQRGFFHAPLKHHTAPRVGKTIDSALLYCNNLLKPGGLCERILPSTYSVWKIMGNTECGAPGYEKFVYENPGSGVIKSLLAVGYDAPDAFEHAQTTQFKIYKAVVIFMWCLAMYVEVKDIVIIITWLLRMPNAKEFGDEAVHVEEHDGEDVYTIQGITTYHRVFVGGMTFIRFCLTCTLTYVGISFLMKQTDYIDLLMDAVTLVFIVEIAQIIYGQALRPSIRDQCENLQPMIVSKYGIDALNRRPGLVDFLTFWGVVLIAATIVWMYSKEVVTPLAEALSCACLGVGETCLEAQKFSYDFWHSYWKDVVPAVFAEVDAMKASLALHSSNSTTVLLDLKTSSMSFLNEHTQASQHLALLQPSPLTSVLDQLKASSRSFLLGPGGV